MRRPQSARRLSLYQQVFLILSCYVMYSVVSPLISFPLLSAPQPSNTLPSPFPLSLLPLNFPPLPLSLLSFLSSGPIFSHYIDGPDDSVEWCTLSSVPLQGLFSLACSCSTFTEPPHFYLWKHEDSVTLASSFTSDSDLTSLIKM